MKTTLHASIIVLTWNGRHNLEHSLPALYPQLGPNDRLVVVDNGSTDGSVAWVSAHYPAVHIIRNETNHGFAAAVNQGIRATDSRFVILLNDDTIVSPGWLEALLAAAESDAGVGMCACAMLQARDPTRFDAAGIEVDRAGIAWNRWHGEPVDAHPTAAPQEVFGPCGGAALYRRQMLDEIGLFDEDFFAYYEDVDLAWRARQAGWRCLYVPQAQLIHAHSATGNRTPDMKRYLLGRNKLWTILKNYPTPQLWWRWPLIVAYDLALCGGGMWQDRSMAALRGRFAALRTWSKCWHKRNKHPSHTVRLVPPRTPWHLWQARHKRPRPLQPPSN